MQEKGFPAFGSIRQTGTPLIPALERGLRLQVETIDGLHQEFADMVNAMEHAERVEFSRLFQQLVTHTEHHFTYENRLMDKTRYPAREEHQTEHRRVLAELSQLNERLVQGELEPVRLYVCERLPRWFRFHVITMDHALAGHLRD